eukprot:TRINITY_DN17964_c0_g1_i1.p1 TRINITY_DN17964_c0_g1~~TRINITY_DN17964_c0_g1_i1.p1  ORF type:complete len:149 (+),score=8.73 TRINITY_DN17964_c0_g1_i1:44-490(+)
MAQLMVGPDDMTEEEDELTSAEMKETIRQQRELIELLKEGLKQKDDEWGNLMEQKTEEIERLRERVADLQFESIMKCRKCHNSCSCEKVEALEMALRQSRPVLRVRPKGSSEACKRPHSVPDHHSNASDELLTHFKRLRIQGGVTASA